MCEKCNPENLNLLIESEKIGSSIGILTMGKTVLTSEHLDAFRQDNSVVLEIRNNQGYIRLGDRDDMDCLDHSEKIEINFCPICGRDLRKN